MKFSSNAGATLVQMSRISLVASNAVPSAQISLQAGVIQPVDSLHCMSPMLSSGFPCSRSLFKTARVLHINAAMPQMQISEWQPVAVKRVTLCLCQL